MHGELRVMIGRPAVGAHQLVREVVEGRTEIVHAVADHERPLVVEIGHGQRAIAVAEALGVHLVEEGVEVAVDDALPRRLERAQVHFGALQLGPGAASDGLSWGVSAASITEHPGVPFPT